MGADRRCRFVKLLLLAAIAMAALVSVGGWRSDAGRGSVVLGLPAAAAPSADYEAQVGRNAAREMERQHGLCTDAALNARVARLAAVIHKASGCATPVRIRILNSREPNGVALPGGYIYLTRGLLRLLPEDELLCAALAHEIAHIALGHMTQMLREREAAQAGAARSTESAGGAEGGTGAPAGNAMHAREKEADQAAARYLCIANIDPRLIVRLLARLSEQPELDASASATHPTWEERIRSVSAYLNSPQFQAEMASWAPFQRQQAGTPPQ